MKTKQLLLILATASALVFSCKKDDENKTPIQNPNPNPSNSCSLSSSMLNDTGYTALFYNTNGSITGFVEKNPSADTSKIELIYDGKIVTVSANGVTAGTYYLNSKGYADSLIVDLSIIRMATYNTYDSNGYLISQNESFEFLGTNSTTIRTYTYSGGNLSKMTEESDGKTTVTTYEYFTDKDNKFAKNNLDALFLGKPNANLTKTETIDGVLSNSYAYEFDSKSNPTKQTATDAQGAKNIVVYNWSCK
ncbi:MAG: hypothetical protein WCK82_04815 [Bacteroidota bacterium]|jgi:hypothetical protein